MEFPVFGVGEDAVEQLVKLSRYYGMVPGFVIAGGGNTSVKVVEGGKELLYVKASGTQLATIERGGFVVLDRSKLRELAATQLPVEEGPREACYKEAIMGARTEPGKGQRPSVEALLHHLVPKKFVVHSHATVVNTLTSCVKGKEIAKELFGAEGLWVEFIDPGYLLGRALKEALEGMKGKCPKVIFMANHGMIVAGDTPEEVKKNTDEVVEKIERKLGAGWKVMGTAGKGDVRGVVNVVGPALRGLLAEGEANLAVAAFTDLEEVRGFVGTELGRELPAKGPLNPDQIVYCTSFPMWFETVEGEEAKGTVERLKAGIAEHKKSCGFLPRVVLVKGVGLFGVGEDYKAAATARDLYVDTIQIMAGATRLGGVSHLTTRQRKFIEDWEVEAYRRQIAKASAKGGRVTGKVAVVTGAAQGFGLEIAQQFAAEGGYVVLTDMNEAGAKKAAEVLCAKVGAGRAMGLAVNVTEGASVEACLGEVVRRFGGFDVLISNAGVLKAGSVKTQSEKDFDFVTAVNYKGYFVCVQKAAGVLGVQHLARPGYWSDIIQINSKSGLEGSNKNGAYAGSKFGGIGLTQSFALELIEDGIKVNSICPGNFFDGPLWSEPNNGLFAQYLRTGKVPGAKTIADVKRFYEAKVPMGRGCETADVMKAVYYIMEQKYETGQAVPVTGGQVMLK